MSENLQSRPRLALVESYSLFRQLLAQHCVRDLGFEVVLECGSAEEALAQLPAVQPDLAVIDCRLPDGPGGEVVRNLRASLPQTRWLVMSASNKPGVVRFAASVGAHGFVNKRADLAVFREAMQRLLANEVYYCPISSRLLTSQIVAESTTQVALTAREQEVLRGFASGLSAKQLAERLGTHVKTVQNHLTSLRDKLGLREPALIVRYAIENGYVEEFDF